MAGLDESNGQVHSCRPSEGGKLWTQRLEKENRRSQYTIFSKTKETVLAIKISPPVSAVQIAFTYRVLSDGHPYYKTCSSADRIMDHHPDVPCCIEGSAIVM